MRSCPSPVLVATALLAVLPGCALENPELLRDTTGAELGWSCESGRCVVVQESFSPPVPTECGERTEHLVGAGPIAILCAVSQGSRGQDVVHELTCRPVACADELDCPQWEERTYACVEGICQSAASWAFDRLDLSALCLSDLPRHRSCPEAAADPIVQERMRLVDAACDERRCTGLPEGCPTR